MRDAIFKAAQATNARYGEWMPERWINLFVEEYKKLLAPSRENSWEKFRKTRWPLRVDTREIQEAFNAGWDARKKSEIARAYDADAE